VLDTTEQVDLVRHASRLEDFLALVALFGREDGVRLGGRDGKWAGDGGQLVLFDEGRVCHVADLDAGFVVADDVLLLLAESQGAKKPGDVPWHQSSTPQPPTS